MSDTREQFKQYVNKRRMATAPLGDQEVVIRSLLGSESAKIDAQSTRIVLALQDNQGARADRLAAQLDALIVRLHVCGEDNSPVFTQDDDEWLRQLDAGILGPLVRACKEHSGVDSTSVKGAAKNSDETSDGSST